MTTRIRAVCFDFQDTLARFAEGDAYDLYVQAASEHGVALTRDRIKMPTEEAWAEYATADGPDHREHSWTEASFVEIRSRVHARRLVAAGVDPEIALLIGRRIDDLESQSSRYVAYDDALPALDALARAGMLLVVVSNHVWRLNEIVSRLFGSRFEGVLTSARVGVRKPHPLIFERALAHLGIEAHDAPAVLMVGDSLASDVRGAERIGMRAVLLDREGTSAAPEDVRVIRSLSQLRELVGSQAWTSG